jgi:hypothetical protein
VHKSAQAALCLQPGSEILTDQNTAPSNSLRAALAILKQAAALAPEPPPVALHESVLSTPEPKTVHKSAQALPATNCQLKTVN